MGGLSNEPVFSRHPTWPPPPRASVVHDHPRHGRLWMGGAHSRHGLEVTVEDFSRALVIDCAGDLSDDHRGRAGSWLSCVFADLEVYPSQIDRIGETARKAAWLLHTDEPTEVYVFCQYGMNRSGLVTGLVLRELGVGAEEAVDRIRTARPGALSNLTFLNLIHSYRPAGPVTGT